MENQGIINKKLKVLGGILLETVAYFRKGYDTLGLDALMIYIGGLEDVLDTCVCLEDYQMLDDILKILGMLDEAMMNEDIVRMTDILAYKACILTDKWLEGNEDI